MLETWFRTTKTLEPYSSWISHQYPRKLVISAGEIKEHFLEAKDFSDDLVDAVMRRFNQLHFTSSCPGGGFRWRHFLEADFVMLALGGAVPHETLSVLHQFIHIDHCIPLCRMVIAPVLVDSIWCAYMFDIHGNKLHIIDPGYTTERDTVHYYLQDKLLDALDACFKAFFENWCLSPKVEWTLCFPKICDEPCSSADSAVWMLHAAHFYNGEVVQEQLSKDTLPRARRNLLVEVLQLSSNHGQIPIMVTRLRA